MILPLPILDVPNCSDVARPDGEMRCVLRSLATPKFTELGMPVGNSGASETSTVGFPKLIVDALDGTVTICLGATIGLPNVELPPNERGPRSLFVLVAIVSPLRVINTSGMAIDATEIDTGPTEIFPLPKFTDDCLPDGLTFLFNFAVPNDTDEGMLEIDKVCPSVGNKRGYIRLIRIREPNPRTHTGYGLEI